MTEIIKFVNATPGTGKTEAAVRHIVKHLVEERDGLLLFVGPTIDLLTKVRDERIIPALRAAGGKSHHKSRVHLIVSESASRANYDAEGSLISGKGSTVQRIIDHIDGARAAGGHIMVPRTEKGVLLITHAAFFMLPLGLENRNTVTVIFDEARKCVFEPLQVYMSPKDVELFRQYLEPTMVLPGSEYAQLQVRRGKESELTTLMASIGKTKNKRKISRDGVSRFSDMVEAIQRGTTEVYFKQDSAGKSQAISFHELHLPSKVFVGWRSVTIMSAYLDKTQLWALLCSGHFEYNGKPHYMHRMPNGTYKMRPSKSSLSITHNLVDVTTKVIPNYEKREAMIKRSYKRATIVSLTGTSEEAITERQLISSAKLNSLLVRDQDAAKKYRQEFLRICADHGNVFGRLKTQALRQIMLPGRVGNETLSDSARALRDWFASVDKVHARPYVWYLQQALRVCASWTDKHGGHEVPLLLSNVQHTKVLSQVAEKQGRAIRILPHQCHGRDDFRDHTMVIYLAAINPKPEAARFYAARFPWYDYKEDYCVDAAIQAVTRSAIRDTTNDDPVLIIVPDPYLMRALHKRLGGQPKVQWAREDYGIERVHHVALTVTSINESQRAKKYRESEKGKATKSKLNEARTINPHYAEYNRMTAQMSRLKKAGRMDEWSELKAKREIVKQRKRDWDRENKATK